MTGAPGGGGSTVVVGAGIIGLAVARELLRHAPGAAVTVLEAADHLGAGQSGHNSGVVHAGIYYKPGSVKSVLCRRGVGLLRDFCDENARYDCTASVGNLSSPNDPRHSKGESWGHWAGTL